MLEAEGLRDPSNRRRVRHLSWMLWPTLTNLKIQDEIIDSISTVGTLATIDGLLPIIPPFSGNKSSSIFSSRSFTILFTQSQVSSTLSWFSLPCSIFFFKLTIFRPNKSHSFPMNRCLSLPTQMAFHADRLPSGVTQYTWLPR